MLRWPSAARPVVAVCLVGQLLASVASSASGAAQSGAPPAVATAASSPGAASSDVPVTPADAAPFIGDWSIPIATTSGSYVGYIALKVEQNTVVALLSADVVPEQRTMDIIKAGKGITIRAKMDYEGQLVEKPTPVAVAVTLTPSGDYVRVGIDFRINNKSFFVTSTGKRLAP